MKSNTRRSRTGARAFTLLEVLMVVVIIGLLAAFVVPALWGTQEKQQIKLAQAAVDTGLSGALDMFRANVGRYPTSDEGLIALYEKPDDEAIQKNWVQTISKLDHLKDPWGREWIYECPGEFNKNSYDLSSAGPDGQGGTDDDVKNWKET